MPTEISGKQIRDDTIESIDIKNGSLTFEDFNPTITWKAPVSNTASLPTINNIIGDARVALAESSINIWNGSIWKAFATSSYTTTNFNSDFTAKTTDGLAEGQINKYFHNHEHNDIYYTELQINNMLSTKSDVTHTHNDIYYTETEADGRFVYKTGDTITGDLVVSGGLTVNGTTTSVDTTNLLIEDNVIVLNKNQTGIPSSVLVSGVEIERGDAINYQFMFRENDDAFVIGATDSLQAVATRQDTPVANTIPFWNATANRFDSSGITVSGSTVTATTFIGTHVTIGNCTLEYNSTDSALNFIFN